VVKVLILLLNFHILRHLSPKFCILEDRKKILRQVEIEWAGLEVLIVVRDVREDVKGDEKCLCVYIYR